LPITNIAPQITAVDVASATPAVGLLMALLPCETSTVVEGRNEVRWSFISTVIEDE
jgi:hypothetical protein